MGQIVVMVEPVITLDRLDFTYEEYQGALHRHGFKSENDTTQE